MFITNLTLAIATPAGIVSLLKVGATSPSGLPSASAEMVMASLDSTFVGINVRTCASPRTAASAKIARATFTDNSLNLGLFIMGSLCSA